MALSMISLVLACSGLNSPVMRPSQMVSTRLLMFSTSGSSEEIMITAPPSSTMRFIST